MLTSPGTTKRLDRLEAAGYVTREPDSGDRRGVLIALTPPGPQAGRRGRRQALANERRILSGLSAAEQRQLGGLLRKLNITLPAPEDNETPPAGRIKPGPRRE
jgi:DNA-binding MarR family transcriptional regulator